MNLLATLLLAHLIADFPLQLNWVFQLKHRHWAGLLLHAAIHAMTTAVLLRNPFVHWPIPTTVCVVHFAFDWLKIRIDFKPLSIAFILDQMAHWLVLILLATRVSSATGALSPEHLYPALAYAALPALLMFLSVLSKDLQQSVSNMAGWSSKRTAQLVRVSHLLGYPLVIAVLIIRFAGPKNVIADFIARIGVCLLAGSSGEQS